MHKAALLLCAFLLLASVAPKQKLECVNFKKDFVPVGNSGLRMATCEVNNWQYRTFLQHLQAKGETEKLKQAQVDSTLWKHELHYNEPYVTYYYSHPAYSFYPVVNISQRGAQLYCEWLTEEYNKTAKVKATFRLPTEQEWMLAAKGGNDTALYPWAGNSLTYTGKGKWKGEPMCNYKVERTPTTPEIHNDNADITAPVESYLPNAYGLYNISGNVSEMVADGNFTKGGSWNSAKEKLTIQSRETAAEVPIPSPQVGFRVVMVWQ